MIKANYTTESIEPASRWEKRCQSRTPEQKRERETDIDFNGMNVIFRAAVNNT